MIDERGFLDEKNFNIDFGYSTFHPVAFSLVFIALSCNPNAPLRNKMLDYYSDNEVYSDLCGKVISKNFNENTKEIIIEVDIKNQDHSFPLNTQTGLCEFVIVNSLDENIGIHPGDEIEFTTASMYFYNGHLLPIIALKKGDETIIEFEDGKASYISWINETFK